MANKTIATVVVLLVLLGLIFWYQQSQQDDEVIDEVSLAVSVFNRTRNVDATTVTATTLDELVYTLVASNTSDDTISDYIVETSINDISELATLIDADGGNYNASTNSLMWTPLDIPANGSIEKKFTVRIKDSLPENSDYMISTTYGNEVLVTVARPGAVVVTPTPTPVAVAPTPTPVYTAPTTGPSAWFAFLLAMTFTVGILLYRAAKSMSV